MPKMSVVPGVAVPEATDLVMDNRGLPSVGIWMESQAAPSQAVLATVVTPAGKGLAIVTAKARARLPPPPGMPGRLRVQVEPAAEPEQLHPEELRVAS